MDVALRAYLENGGVYAGSSAGSIIFMDSIEHFAPADDPSAAPKVYPGLGFIDGALIPHADSVKHGALMKSIASKYEHEGRIVTLLNDHQALYIDEKEFRVI